MADIYMRNVRDWRDATIQLSFEEKGYFDELINLIYLYDGYLPDDDDFISKAMPVNKRLHRRLKKKLIEYGVISIIDGLFFNKRAALEIEKINSLSSINKLNSDKRWAKSLKSKESGNAIALQKVKVKGESEHGTKNSRQKCTIDEVLDPDGDIPEEYRRIAEDHGLEQIQRRFEDWAGWWHGENGRKAGREGWLRTWKTRVRKDVERQMAGVSHKPGRSGNSGCSTTDGARLALDRRRNRRRKIR